MPALAISTLLGVVCLAHAKDMRWVQKEASVPPHSSETSSWLKLHRAPADEVMRLTVALRVEPERRQELERTLFEVSDPRHESYGKFLGMDEITALLAVPKERAMVTRQYFEEHGATDIAVAPFGDTLTVSAPVSSIEAALRTKIHVFAHRQQQAARILRASEPYYLPAEVSVHVAMVGELLQFPRLPRRLRMANAGEEATGTTWPNDCPSEPKCQGLVTPGVLLKRYNITDNTPSPDGNSMSVAEFQGEYYKQHDLMRFARACHRNVSVDTLIGGNRPRAGVEAELDIEYIKAVAPSVKLTVYYQNMYSLLDWVHAITQLEAPPLVHSVSYGNDEAQQESEEYMITCNTGFMKAGVRGLSILFASGDMGVCGREGCGRKKIRFNPDFPAASPYITAVGGTDFVEKGVIGDEMAWDASGGGFSDTFPMPDYQKDAVQAYLNDPAADLPPSYMWNSSGRAYPDVSALGGEKNYYCISTDHEWGGVAGTSASCPVVAGIVAKVNGILLASGRPVLGFLNPLIYQLGSVFQDVAKGKNSAGTPNGFKAIKGWDPATGFGTPNFGALAQAVLGSHAEGDVHEIVV